MTVNRAEERAEWLRSVLGELTPIQRFVVECRHGMRDGHEYRLREIARLMGRDYSTVREHYRSAVKRLKQADTPPVPINLLKGENRSPAEGDGLSVLTNAGCEGPVCLSPLIPEHHGLTQGEVARAWGETLGN